MIGDQLEGNLHQADETNPFGWCYIDFVLTNINECGDAIRLNNLRVLQGYHLDVTNSALPILPYICHYVASWHNLLKPKII